MNDAERTTSPDRSPRARTFRHPHRSRSRRGAIAFSRARRPSTVRAPPDTSGNAPSRPSRGPLGSLGDARLARLDQNTSSKQPTARTLELSRASSGIPLIIITSRRVARATPVGETSRHAARARARFTSARSIRARFAAARAAASSSSSPDRRATAGARFKLSIAPFARDDVDGGARSARASVSSIASSRSRSRTSRAEENMTTRVGLCCAGKTKRKCCSDLDP